MALESPFYEKLFHVHWEEIRNNFERSWFYIPMTVIYIYNPEENRNEIVKVKINIIKGQFPGLSIIFLSVSLVGKEEQRVRIRRVRIVSTSAGITEDDYESIVLTLQRYEQFRTMVQRWSHWDNERRAEAMLRLEDFGLASFVRNMGGIWTKRG